MKLTYVLTTADARAGTEKALADQTRAMAARGHDVTVVSVYRLATAGFDFGDRVRMIFLTDLEGPTGAPSLVIPTEWDNQFCAASDHALIEHLGHCDADVVVTSTPALSLFALLAAPEQIKVVAQEHRSTMARGVTAEPLLRHGRRLDVVVSLTQRNSDWLRERWKGDVPQLEVIPNALPATGRPTSGRRQEVIMSAGRFVRSKGFSDLIRAFAQVAEDFPEWRLRLFGDGPDRQRLISTTRNLGIAGQVELMPPTDDIESEWARASIGALASRQEGLPLVLLEARGAHLPVVAYDCLTGPREIIEHGKDGYLVPVGDVAGLADALRLLMGDEGRRDEMGVYAERSLERFRPAVVAEHWARLFDDLVQRPMSARQLHDADAPATDAPVEPEAIDVTVTSETDVRGDRPEIPIGPEGLVPWIARERTRADLAQLFSAVPVRCRPLRSGAEDYWAVPTAARDDVLDRLACADLPSTEIRLYAGGTRLDADGFSWRVDPGEVNRADVTRLHLFTHYGVPGTTFHVGYGAGLGVELWDEDERRPGVLRGRRTNLEADALTAEQFDRPLFTPWEPMRSSPVWSTVEFPIDAVYTWVDGSDPAWRARRADATGTSTASSLAAGDLRYLNRDELRYSLRSLAAHAPWVRRIFLVTDAQRPAWLSDTDRITVIDHRDVFPDVSVLPVFNSQAIETVLHRIPGLAEHFLYLNDDCFFLREQRPEQYFSATGHPKFFPSPTKINDLGALAEPHEAAGMNNRSLIEERYGVTITQGMLHSPHPHRRSVLERLERMYPEAIDQTRRSKFRSEHDVAPVSSLAQYTGHLEGAYDPGTLRVSFVPLGAPDTSTRLVRAASSSLDYLTLGEVEEDPDPELTQEMATNFMRSAFPIPAPWEG